MINVYVDDKSHLKRLAVGVRLYPHVILVSHRKHCLMTSFNRVNISLDLRGRLVTLSFVGDTAFVFLLRR